MKKAISILAFVPLMTLAQEYGLNGYEIIEDWKELTIEQPKVIMMNMEENYHYKTVADQFAYEFAVVDVIHYELVLDECRAFVEKHGASFDHPYDDKTTVSDINDPFQAIDEVLEDGKRIKKKWLMLVENVHGEEIHTIVVLQVGPTSFSEEPVISLVFDFNREFIDLPEVTSKTK